ncbi:hypothetical protein L1987_32811 [Smallanthus sonchifolius]|uniref:Uncharacterized protein n=1 Tax=Smallanthus sonchifolius TaxID=185202 RepID=A0ACB9HQH1_9ASTR|nr:hypothetical protein L1987_32811 [Smallanthus sonchifolius]
MDFITKLPRTAKGHDTIWVIVDCLTKRAHFLPIRKTLSSERFAALRDVVWEKVQDPVCWSEIGQKELGSLEVVIEMPERILAQVGEVAYWLELPNELSGIHPTFHVTNERICHEFLRELGYVCIGLTLTGGLCGWLTVVQLIEEGVTTVTHGITGIPMEGTIPFGEIVSKVWAMDSDAWQAMKSYPADHDD